MGYTFVELIATLAILSVLAAVALPFVEHAVKREKEQTLKIALREIRLAIDAYKQAVDAGELVAPPGGNGYPSSLDTLVSGGPNQKLLGARLYFLRRIPRDPFATDDSVPASQTWGLRSFASPPDAPTAGVDVFDVYSLSNDQGLNGVPYRDW